MDMSLLLAKLLGLYFLISATLYIFRTVQVKAAAKELAGSRSTLAVSGEISLIFGLLVVLDHSIWELNWKGLVTLLGYLFILRGILRIAFPSQIKALAAKIISTYFGLFVLVLLVIGAYLTYCGFQVSSMALH